MRPVLCPILTPARLLPPIGRFRVRCGIGVRVRQSYSDFNERGNNLAGGRKWAQHRNMNTIRLTVQCFPSNGFLWEAFNVKLCTLCLYSGFIFLPVQNIHHQ